MEVVREGRGVAGLDDVTDMVAERENREGVKEDEREGVWIGSVLDRSGVPCE